MTLKRSGRRLRAWHAAGPVIASVPRFRPCAGASMEALMAIAVAQPDLTVPADLALESRTLVVVPRFQQAIDRPAKIHIDEILTAWREAERALGVIAEGSPEWARVNATLVSLRASYHQLFAERRDRQSRPETAGGAWAIARQE